MANKPLDRIDLMGWTFTHEASACDNCYHAIYSGSQRGAAHRGSAIVLAQGTRENGSQYAPYWAARGFADGYFGATPTLSPARAAALSLQAINDWLFGQGWSEQRRAKSSVCLGAILLIGRRLGLVRVGDCAFYLW